MTVSSDDGYGRGTTTGITTKRTGRRYRGGFRDEGRFEPRMHGPREFERADTAVRRAARLHPRCAGDGSRAGWRRCSRRAARCRRSPRCGPKDYSEARTIGERFRDGTPVIMDLVTMDNADAKRLVDFAAGLAFALRGSFDKVATKVFLLSPADVDVTRRGTAPHRRGRLLRLSVGIPVGPSSSSAAVDAGVQVGWRRRAGPPAVSGTAACINVTHLPVVRSAQLALFFEILGFALFVFWLLLIARVVVEFIRSFSRDWQPKGVTVVILEVIMTVTDPPVKLLRRHHSAAHDRGGPLRPVDHGAVARRVHRHAAGVQRSGLRTDFDRACCRGRNYDVRKIEFRS